MAAGPSREGTTLVLEPRFRGATHSLFNAALLAAAAEAGPEDRVVFAAEPSHLAWVRRSLPSEYLPRISRWQELRALPRLRLAGRLRRTAAETGRYAAAFALPLRPAVRRVVFCSVTKAGLPLLKAASFLGGPPVLAVIHQLFQLGRGGDGPVSLERVLALPQRRRLHLVMPGSAARETLARDHPRLARRLVALEPPYFWQRREIPEAPRGEEVCFGLFGTGLPGRIEPFVELARTLRGTPAAFRVVGFVPAEIDLDPADAEALSNPAREPLPPAEMGRVADRVHLAVWMSRESFQLRFSASFLDCLSFVRPLIALRSPFIEHYFRELGEIGILCDDTAALHAAVRDIAADFPAERYRRWCATILETRRRFAPAAVGRRMRQLEEG
jgi:hypothetical protein